MSFFNSENGGLGPLVGWMGQVVDESTWLDNTANSDFKHKLHTSDDVAGFSYRYKVRIFGRDSEVKTFSDDQLEMAEVLLPTTGGSGHGGSTQTPNIKQGMYVFGFYKDGIDATEPMIFGVLPNNAQTNLFCGDPDTNFVPRSGYFCNNRQIPVSTKNIKIGGEGVNPCKEGINSNSCDVASRDKKEDGERTWYIPKTTKCEGPSGELVGLKKVLKQLLNAIQKAKRTVNSFLGAASDISSDITDLINDATNLISGLVKSLIGKIRGYVVNWLNNKISQLYELLPPNLRSQLADGTEKSTNLIQCLFNKIVSRLGNILKDLLLDIVEKYVNAPLCAVEAFVGNFISNIIGDLTEGINDIISSILGPLGDIAGIIFQAMDVLVGVINFLSCEESQDCRMVDEWSFFNGSNISLDKIIGGVGDKIRAFSNIDNNSAISCNSSQIPCGPPTLEFFGSGISASGNLIISPNGYIMGVDLTDKGAYTSPPDVRVIDSCGLGNGAVLFADTIQNADGLFEVNDVVVIDPGSNYLNSTNGSTGGDGSVFSFPNETIIQSSNGINVFPPNQIVNVISGEIGFFPSNSVVEVFNSSGDLVQTINGQGQLTSIEIIGDGVITTPDIETKSFPENSDTYKLFMCIKDIAILNEGINYSVGDKIVITPSNGTVAEPVVNEFGKIVDVKISSFGCGFIDIPSIIVESQNGINAILVPVFDFKPIDDSSGGFLDSNVVNVVDCVGKIPNKK